MLWLRAGQTGSVLRRCTRDAARASLPLSPPVAASCGPHLGLNGERCLSDRSTLAAIFPLSVSKTASPEHGTGPAVHHPHSWAAESSPHGLEHVTATHTQLRGGAAAPLAGAAATTSAAQTVADILLRKSAAEQYVMGASEPISEAIRRFASNGTLFALIVVSDNGAGGATTTTAPGSRVLGLVTARDLLRRLHASPSGAAKDAVSLCMTPSARVVHVRPEDTTADAALLMSEMRVSHLPVLRDGEILGIISIQDLSNAALEGARGGKESFVKNVLPRQGIAETTRIAARGGHHHHHHQQQHQQHGIGTTRPVDFSSGSGSAGASAAAGGSSAAGAGFGVGAARPGASPLFLRTGAAGHPRAKRTETPSEDAHFVTHVAWPADPYGAAHQGGQFAGSPLGPPLAFGAGTGSGLGGLGGSGALVPAVSSLSTVTYMGLADGVGSWHDFDVDPRLYATRLMRACEEFVWKKAAAGEAPPPTLDVLVAGWEAVSAEGIVGSCTAAIISVDSARNQLSITGVGDCGCILLRDTDIGRVGSLLRGGTETGIRAGWRVYARATQQLRGFNMPFQLGFAPGHEDKFEKPWHGETLVMPARDEDIVIAATDGLWDNADETDILSILEDWDRGDLKRRGDNRRRIAAAAASSGATSPSGLLLPGPGPVLMAGESVGMQGLAQRLADAARAFSLDRMRDGPFARLAKENDILWSSGGRPDDVTVITARLSTIPPPAPATRGESLGRFRETVSVAAAAAQAAAPAAPAVAADAKAPA